MTILLGADIVEVSKTVIMWNQAISNRRTSFVVYQPRVSELDSLNSSILVNTADKQSLASLLPGDPLALNSQAACPLLCECGFM